MYWKKEMVYVRLGRFQSQLEKVARRQNALDTFLIFPARIKLISEILKWTAEPKLNIQT